MLSFRERIKWLDIQLSKGFIIQKVVEGMLSLKLSSAGFLRSSQKSYILLKQMTIIIIALVFAMVCFVEYLICSRFCQLSLGNVTHYTFQRFILHNGVLKALRNPIINTLNFGGERIQSWIFPFPVKWKFLVVLTKYEQQVTNLS